MNTFMNGPRFFWFHFFNFFHQFNHFYYFTSLHAFQDVKNHCAHLRDIESMRAGEHEITKLKKKIFASNPEKKLTQKEIQKDMNEMESHKIGYLIVLVMRMRKRHLFCTSNHHNVYD